MKKQIISTTVFFLTALSVVFVTGCATSPDKSHPKQYTGHWSVGPAYSWFTALGATEHWFLDTGELPKQVRNYLLAQTPHSTWHDGQESSVYLVVEGYVALAPSSADPFPIPQLYVQRVISYGPAHADFVASRMKHVQ